MPIRDPKYIVEARERLSKNLVNGNTKRQHVTAACIDTKFLQEDKTIVKKRLKLSDISTEKSVTASTADVEQDDCIITGHVENYNLTADDIARRKQVLDNTIVLLCIVKENVLSKNRQLTDESMDQILRIVRETSCFETQSSRAVCIQYVEYPDLITACYNKSVQIIGGNCTKHWRCVLFDGETSRI